MRRASEGGITLVEILVAWSLALTILLACLSLLYGLRRTYLRAQLAADAEQRVRTALDSIARDLRLAGLGVDPDGAPLRPDESVEGAWAGAIASRGDRDGSDRAASQDPEQSIAGIFPSTRTGNDEIVVYALRNQSGSGGSEIAFEADVTSAVTVTTPAGDRVAPRDGEVELVRLTRVVGADGDPGEPGRTLYRAVIANNADLWGTGNAVIWQPVADGVAILGFRYFDEEGAEIAAPGGSQSLAPERERIAAVEARVVALARRPDPDWRDPADPTPATASYRKAEGVLWIALRSAGAVARAEPPP